MNSDLSSLQVRDIGEQGILERLQRFCPPEIIGDDAAVLAITAEESLVVTTDMLVDGVHFSDITTSPEDTGWRASAANLSDLAAMGAFPLGITVGLGLPGHLAVSWVERLYQGMTECLQKYNVPILGGDIVRSPITTLAITAFGQANPNFIIRRSTAQVGDAIIVTGIHGASRAGLDLLLNPQIGQNLKSEEKAALIKAHQRPNPRLDVIPILQEIFTSPCPISISGMDSSDGLADAVLQICRASRVGAILEQSKIPLPSAFHKWLTPGQWLHPPQASLNYALYGGEDFELVLCLPPPAALTLVQKLGAGASIIGTITPGLTVILHHENERIPDQALSLSQGFQHFS